MNANEQTLRKLNEGQTSEYWVIDATGNCGQMIFRDMVSIMYPLHANPAICINGYLGLRAVKKAVALIEAERAKFGLTTLE